MFPPKAAAGKRSRPLYLIEQNRREAQAKRRRLNPQTASNINMLVVPGFTRVGGSYARSSNPGEKKYWDINTNTTALNSATGTIFSSWFLGLKTGTGENERIGSRITLASIHAQIKLALYTQAVPAVLAGTCRVLVWMDRQANGAAPTSADLLQELTAAGVDPDIYSFRNLDNASRFRILADKWVTLNPATQNASSGSNLNSRFIKFHFKVPKTTINFSSTLGAITEIKSTNFGMLFIPDSTTLMNVAFRTRCRYFDN